MKAEFSPELDWNRKHHLNYAAFVSRWVRENDLLHFDRAAVARLIEHGARLRESKNRLSARMMDISDVVSEASFWASRNGRARVGADDVEHAIAKREYRSNLLEERIRELIDDGTLVIDTRGRRVGEVNGLAVLDLGDHAFGRPTRVSARVAIGRGSIASIEREIELSGPIHSKGFLILSGYLAATYAQDAPLALERIGHLRAVLRRDRGRLGLRRRARRASLRARRAPARPGDRDDRVGRPARPDPGGRRRQPQDRGLLRHLQGARPHRAGRA